MLKLHFWSPYFYWCPMLMLTLGIYTFGTTCYGFIISVKESRGLLTVIGHPSLRCLHRPTRVSLHCNDAQDRP
jgi:hypothetical protein